MPTVRHVSLVQKLQWHVSGNISPTAFAIGDVDGHGDNAFVIGNLVGDLFIFKGNDPDGQPWLTCKGLGTITAVAIGDIRNWGKNSIVVMSAEGLCHIFDVAELEDDRAQMAPATTGATPAAVARSAGAPGKTSSIYSSTPRSGSYQQSVGGGHHSGIPATPSIKPVPDLHHHHHHHHHGTPPLPPAPQNTPHGSTSSSISAFPHHSHSQSSTPIHQTHMGSMAQAGSRRGSDIPPGNASRATSVLANLIGTPPLSSMASHGHSSSHHPRSVGGHSNANSPTGTPLLKPQHMSGSNTPAHSTRDHGSRKQSAHSRHHGAAKTQVHTVGGRRVLERPNLTLPVPVNINRAHIADIDGDGLNELVLARTDRILHSYALQISKPASPNTSAHPNNQPLKLVKLLSRSSSMSAESSGLLSPSDDRRETIIHYPSLSSTGRQYHTGSVGGSEAQDGSPGVDSSNRLVLVEKKRWALDGQINCLSVTKDIQTGLPILLVAQPGLKFVMVDHTGNISEPMTQIQRTPTLNSKVEGPDTPTRGAGSGDVATDIVCGTQYVNGEKKNIIGLMSMDGAFALHDLYNNTVKVHDLDSTHKIFGFSKLNFGKDHLERQAKESRKARPGYGQHTSRYVDDINDGDIELEDEDYDNDDGFDLGSDGGETLGDNYNEHGYGFENRSRRPRKQAPSLLIPEPYGARFQRSDMFVGCSWSGITFFIDQDFNTAQYDFDARVCAFGAGQYAVSPGRNEPCLFYVDFEDNIFVYYNLYIQTKPTIQFRDVLNSDAALVRSSQKMLLAEKQSVSAKEPVKESPSFEDIRDGIKTPHEIQPWEGKDMQEFVHDSLYNVNRYEDEFQELKRLADIECAKRAAIFEEEAAKERQHLEAERRAQDETAAAAAAALSNAARCHGSPTYIDPRLRKPSYSPSEKTMVDHTMVEAQRPSSRRSMSQRRKFSAHDIQTGLGMTQASQSQYTQSHLADDPHLLSPRSAASSSATSSPTSPKGQTGFSEKRRSSLLIKDVLNHYEGKITPPMKSPTSPSSASQQSSKSYKGGPFASSGSPGSTASLTNIIKRFSLKDLGNGGRLSRSAGNGSGSSSVGSSSPIHPLIGGAALGKGKTLDARVGKSLRVNRPSTRNRQLGVVSRKLGTGTKSRLSLQQDCEDESEEEDDGIERAPSEGTGETDGDNLLEFDGSSRKSGGDEEDLQEAEDRSENGNSDFFTGERNEDDNYVEDDATGAYTPSTISPIPSPGRFYSQQGGRSVDQSPGVEDSTFMLGKSLLSPSVSSRPFTSTATVAVTGKTSRTDQGGSRPSSSSSQGHTRQRSSHGLLDASLGLLPTREIVATTGLSSGPNSAGAQDGRRSRAESVLSTGSDIGGVIVPDITLMASSFPSQSHMPLSTSEPYSQRPHLSDDSEDGDDDVEEKGADDQGTRVVRRPARRSNTLGSQDSGATRGTGSGSDTGTGPSAKQKGSRSNAPSGADVKLMPAPLPRSHQHYQRYQQEHHLMQQQQQHQGSWTRQLDKDAALQSGHVSFSGTARPNSGGSSGGLVDTSQEATYAYQSGYDAGFGRGLTGKSSSTTSSTAASDFGSGPSSPLSSNVNSAHAILSNPSLNSFKGFGVLSLPVASPSGSTATAHQQQHQYFASSHYHQQPQQPPGSSSSMARVGPLSREPMLEDDRASIRSKTSSFRTRDSEWDSRQDISSVLAGAPTFRRGNDHDYSASLASSSSTAQLASDSLVRRLEELQQQDQDKEERQRRKERELHERHSDSTKTLTTTSTKASSTRPSILSRANSGASVKSSVSHSTVSSTHPHHPSAPVSGHSSSGAGTTGANSAGPSSGSSKSAFREADHDSSKRLKNRPGMGQGL
ncbi:KICSTOR complex protein ITFG2 [Entomortierella parvispora]|uniref:KICSTOR complex protein ITFG2 n=1 Tax=Entomortierella parvispora TaxID=205924 RepID=A0A9P3H2A0_9FUNG|nr:KICSTOR complex protein ITFG2 [Entomortierella parvispora]